jgi:hypothetical protein
MVAKQASNWTTVQKNPTYLCGALSDSEGCRIKWHSPTNARSSQVFCISAFGTLRSVPDGHKVLNQLLANKLEGIPPSQRWELIPEHTDAKLLGETGQGTPTNIDVFCRSEYAVVCIESKFIVDARQGLEGCGQIKVGHCAGHYGPYSDLKTSMKHNCRLEGQDGHRDPRSYWKFGRDYFLDDVFQEQGCGDTCPFAGSAFQLMRNFLFAAMKARPECSFGVLVIAPEKTSSLIRQQVDTFKSKILKPNFRDRVGLATYDELADLLSRSPHVESRALGEFLHRQIDLIKLCRIVAIHAHA